MNKLLILLSSLFIYSLLGCSMFGSKDKNEIVSQKVYQENKAKQRDLFQEGVVALDSERFKKAAKTFEKFLKKYPTTNLEFMALYNLGSSYEGMGHCGAAANRYRRVVKNTKTSNKKIRARSMLRLSYMYECLDKDTMVVATLFDVLKKRDHLDKEVAQAEVPARLAAAYSRLGNRVEAKKFFKQAQDGLKIINRTTFDKSKKKKLMAKTFFYMGDLRSAKIKGVKDIRYIEHINALQTYLLRSVELNVEKWSLLSANQIVEAYDKVISHVQTHKNKIDAESNTIQKRKLITESEKMSIKTLQSIQELNAQRFPDNSEPKLVSKLFDKIKERKKTIEIVLASSKISNPLTKDAVNRKKRLTPKKTQDIKK